MRAAMVLPSLKSDWEKDDKIRNALAAREERWLNILKKEKASLSEITVADFGTKAPVGLDINHWIDDPEIALQDARKSKNYNSNKRQHWKFFASVTWQTPEKVNLHPVFNLLKNLPTLPLQKNVINMLSHETVHNRQSFEMQLNFNTIAHHRSSLQKAVPEDESALNKIKNLQKPNLSNHFGKYAIKDYLAKNVEIEARMHEIISNAYHEWERMPVTQNEFFAGMHHAGMKVPKNILDELESTKDGQEALENFKLGKTVKDAVKRPVNLLNQVQKYAEICGNDEEIWRENNTLLYGHLLELYGDIKGRARMGFEENPREAFIFLKKIKESDSTLSDDEIERYAANVSDHSVPVLLNLCPEYRKPLINIFSKQDRLPKSFQDQTNATDATQEHIVS